MFAQCLINENIFHLTRFQAKSSSQSLTNFSTTLIYTQRPVATGRQAPPAFSFPISSSRLDMKAAPSKTRRKPICWCVGAGRVRKIEFTRSPSNSQPSTRTNACKCSTTWPERRPRLDQKNFSASTRHHRIPIKSHSERQSFERAF